MLSGDLGFRWMKVKDGRMHFAVIELDVQKNDLKNEIIEDYLINGCYNNSNGMKVWTAGLVKGLEFALSKSSDFWTITIKKLEAPIMDSNPAIIGYTALLAFMSKAKITIDSHSMNELENFVYESWKDDNASKIPNFYQLIYE